MPRIPLYVIMPGDSDAALEYVWFPDYALLLPEYNRRRILARLKSRKAIQTLIDRHTYFTDNEVIRIAKLRDSEIIAIRVKPWFERICADVCKSISDFQDAYTLEQLQIALEQGRLSKY